MARTDTARQRQQRARIFGFNIMDQARRNDVDDVEAAMGCINVLLELFAANAWPDKWLAELVAQQRDVSRETLSAEHADERSPQ